MLYNSDTIIQIISQFIAETMSNVSYFNRNHYIRLYFYNDSNWCQMTANDSRILRVEGSAGVQLALIICGATTFKQQISWVIIVEFGAILIVIGIRSMIV